MQPKSAKLLEDIRDAAAFIRQCASGKSLKDYSDDRILRQAVELNFEILGEAIQAFSVTTQIQQAALTITHKIIAFRNILIHGYDLIDLATVWQVIQDDVPRLEQQVSKLLEDTE